MSAQTDMALTSSQNDNSTASSETNEEDLEKANVRARFGKEIDSIRLVEHHGRWIGYKFPSITRLFAITQVLWSDVAQP